MTSDSARTQSNTTSRTGGTGDAVSDEKDLTIQWVMGASYVERDVLQGARLRIGRGAECHMRLEHSSVSREHAELYRQGPIYALKDLGSTNGTRINGRRAEHAVVAEGDVIRVGDFVGIVSLVSRSLEVVPFGELAPDLWGGTMLLAALATAKAAAVTDIPVVLIGETGTGKERVARAIHHWSERTGRFHALNCSAVPAGLAEAELFGHQRGAFTGAERARVGHFRAAHGGTLFLDEVADLPLAVQAKVLRAIEEHEIVPLGDTDAVAADARIVVASHEPLERFVDRKTFRADLHARLAGFRLVVPPLRQRRDEIPGLFFHFLRKHGTKGTWAVESKLVERLCLHDWPGNVRELDLFTRKLLALREEEPVLRREFADGILEDTSSGDTESLDSGEKHRNRREHDLFRLNAALAKNNGNMTAAAASARISRRRAYRLLEDAAKITAENGTSSSPQSGNDQQ